MDATEAAIAEDGNAVAGLNEGDGAGHDMVHIRFQKNLAAHGADGFQKMRNVEAVSRERRCLKGFIGASVVPSLRLSSFAFTGATAAE